MSGSKRDEFTKATKRKARERAGNRCERCGASDCRLEVNHRVPCWAGGDNSLGNAELLCAGWSGSCHAIQTREDEALQAHYDRLAGRINAKSGKPVRAQCQGTHAGKGQLKGPGFRGSRKFNGDVEWKT